MTQHDNGKLTMLLNNYYSEEGNKVVFTRQQASDFAKNIAGDFNPIHDVESKRFCVPGDLLFAVSLNKYGLSQKMGLTFSGMVTDGTPIIFPPATGKPVTIHDDKDKAYLTLECSGDTSHDEPLIRALTQNYVEFSGQTFPHILVPLMADNNVMINPDRPLVIYESMTIDMDRLDVENVTLALAQARLNVDGKRGNAILEFNLISDGETVGRGAKSMVLSGLREYDEDKISRLVEEYSARKKQYLL